MWSRQSIQILSYWAILVSLSTKTSLKYLFCMLYDSVISYETDIKTETTCFDVAEKQHLH